MFKFAYQPGGTFTAVSGNWTSRVVTKGTDLFGLGRWSFINHQGKDSKLLTIITAHRVCKTTPSSVGEKRAFTQQFQTLSSRWREQGLPVLPNPHRQFILSLQSWLETLSSGHDLIHALDHNEDITDKLVNTFPYHFLQNLTPQAPFMMAL